MTPTLIPVKTADGQAELSSRQRRVSQRHRTVLLLVDGRRTEAQVRTLGHQAGVPDSCFDELLQLGLIALPPPPQTVSASPVQMYDVVDIALPVDETDSVDPESLPPSRTLQPESVVPDSVHGDVPKMPESLLVELEALDGTAADTVLEEARGILLRAVRAEAPVAGSLTMLRLKRARSRAELASLIEEVEARIIRRGRSLAAQQTLRHVRRLLEAQSRPFRVTV